MRKNKYPFIAVPVFVTFLSAWIPFVGKGQTDTIELPAVPISASRISVESRRLNQAVTILSEDILVKGQARTSLQDMQLMYPAF